MRVARLYPYLLEEKNKFILYRPTDNKYGPEYYGPDVEVWSYDTADGHCRIHYTEDSDSLHMVFGSDGALETIPDFVLKSAEALETVWAKEIEDMGYQPPPADGNAGGISDKGTSLFDCYIINLSGCYGYTDTDQGKPYIVITNNFEGFSQNHDPEGAALGAMRVTIAHEFFHAVQVYYIDWPYDFEMKNFWWEENTAVWMEEEVYDFINDYFHYIGSPYDDLNDNGQWNYGEPYYDILGQLEGDSWRKKNGWFDWPFLSLECQMHSFAEYQEYGGALWPKHLSKEYGPEIIRDIFSSMLQNDWNALSSIQAILTEKGSSLPACLKDFKAKILIRDFKDEQWFPLVWHIADFSEYPEHLNPENPLFSSSSFYSGYHGSYKNGCPGNLDHLSSHYLLFKAPENKGNIQFSFERISGEAELSCLLMLATQNGLWERREITLNPDIHTGEITIHGFGQEAEYRRIVAIPINTFSSSYTLYNNIPFTLDAGFETMFSYQVSLNSGMNLFSPAISIEQSFDSHQFLLDYFTPNSLYSISYYDKQAGEWIKNSWVGDTSPYSVSGPHFDLVQGGIYLLYLKNPVVLTLESYLNTEGICLDRGINFFSYSPQMLNAGSKDAFTFFTDCEENPTVIRKKNNWNGKWEITYGFFQKCAGENFSISPGETYIIEIDQ